ncbi:MAG TPA: penicillin-binding transpeptidase domain-containing protein, partial [Caulobacteraceae bacterium]|nr:penicillin-binding transpeptidase domain-containing protein [Caulobacteraceae bacterium]
QPAPRQVIGQPALSYMIRMMRQVIASGTGTRAAVKGYDLAGKTGTTSDYRDAWFVGFTGGFVTAVWCGRDDNTPMKRVTGGGAPAEIWRGFMAPILPHIQAQAIPGGAPLGPPPDAIGNLLDNEAEPTERAPPSSPESSPDPPF